jgi:predicted methyltransferase
VPSHEASSGAERHFPDPSTYAHRLDDPSRDAWQKPAHVVGLLDVAEGATVVDLGAGTGYFVRYLSEAVGSRGRVLALDTERSMVDAMYERAAREGLLNVKPDAVPPDDPALTPRSVDRVLVVNTWHHIAARVPYAEKLRAALRPGGMVLIVDFTMESPIGPPASKRLTSDTVIDELRAAGFEAETLQESLPHQYVVAGRVP